MVRERDEKTFSDLFSFWKETQTQPQNKVLHEGIGGFPNKHKDRILQIWAFEALLAKMQ